ncbi:MAG TPA: ABC transporter substrate-binding protein [Firmicutes bacterium]|nr:ABC transporter substrate-binding protein [Bacillota bacterium]
MKKFTMVLFCLMLLTSMFLICEGAPKKVTLRLMQFKPEITDQVHNMAKQYNKENPNVTMEVEILQADYEAVLRTKLNARNAPDIFMTNGYFYNQVYLDYSYDLTNESFMKQIDPNTLEAATLDGKIYGFPFLVESYAFIYNKELFTKAGITELPKTLTQLEAACRKLQAKGIIPFGNGYREGWVFKHIFSHLMAGDGNFRETAEKLNSGELKFGDLPSAMKIFDLLDLTLKYGNPRPLETDFTQQITLLATGEVAMIHQGSWAEEGIRKINPQIQIGYLPVPVGEDPDKARVMVDANILYRLNKDSKNLNEAKKWLEWLIASDSGREFIVNGCKFIPTIKGINPPDVQLANETIDYMFKNLTYPWVQGYWPASWETHLGNLLQDYCGGARTRQQVIEEFNRTWLALVN